MASFVRHVTTSPEATRQLGRDIGRRLRAPTVITLTGDLGTGKTVLVQGLARGLGVPDTYYVTSPSYTLINEYPGRMGLVHVDLYRLETHFDIEDIGLADILNGDGIVAIEWADRLGPVLPDAYLDIRMKMIDDLVRDIRITAYGLAARNLLKSLACPDA